jgi:hypothetical protein
MGQSPVKVFEGEKVKPMHTRSSRVTALAAPTQTPQGVANLFGDHSLDQIGLCGADIGPSSTPDNGFSGKAKGQTLAQQGMKAQHGFLLPRGLTGVGLDQVGAHLVQAL